MTESINPGAPGPEFRPERVTDSLQDIAQEVGSKAATLLKLRSKLREAQVPSFVPIKHSVIFSYLKGKIPHIEGLWQRFLREVHPGDITLSPKACLALQEIREAIEKAMETDPPVLDSLSEFIAHLDPSKKVMVRSSSQEDSATSANAGGNASVASDMDAISLKEAMKVVISSYFSEKSLSQRLEGHDDITPFPLCSFFVQEMIGEIPGIIPVSLVMYSRESGMDTQGLVHIQASYGHGEGVVNSLVPFDSYFLQGGHLVGSTIAHKTERLRKEENTHEMENVENPSEIADKPCLSPKAIALLNRAAKEIERAYDHKAMDIEAVVIGDQVYVVQARELVPKEATTPSYVDTAKLSKEDSSEDIQLIDEGKGCAQILDFYVSAKSLNEAGEIYTRLSANQKKQIKAVIVSQMAAATSHAATEFRRCALPIICVKNLDLLQKQTSDKRSIILDVQQQKLFYLHEARSGILKEGRIAFPLPKQQTLLSLDEAQKTKIWQALEPEPATKIADLKIAPEDRDLSLLEGLKKLGTHEDYTAQIHHVQLMIKRLTLLGKGKKGVPSDIIGPILASLSTLKQLLKVLESGKSEHKEEILKQVLFQKRVVEAKLFQEEIPEIVRSVSLKSFFSEVRSKQKALESWDRFERQTRRFLPPSPEPVKTFYCTFYRLGRMVFSTLMRDRFERFLYDLSKTPLKEEWVSLLAEAERTGSLTYLLNQLFFVKEAWGEVTRMKEPSFYVEAFKNALTSIRDHKTTLEPFGKAKRWKTQLSHWQDPKQFKTLFPKWAVLLNDVLEKGFTCVSTNPSEGLKEELSPAFVQSWTKHMFDFVDLFDLSIKEITASTAYTNAERVVSLRKMLILYATLMDRIFSAVSETGAASLGLDVTTVAEEKLLQYRTPECKKKELLEHYGQIIQEGVLSSALTEDQLLPSPGFDVSGATIGSHANLARQYTASMTLEDRFTLIHQNMLAALNICSGASQMSVDQLPGNLRLLINSVTLSLGRKVAYIDSSSFPMLHIHINLPQRNHSSFIDVFYDALTEQVTFDLHFVGEDRVIQRMTRGVLSMAIEGMNLGFGPFEVITSKPGAASDGTGLGASIKWVLPAAKLSEFLKITGKLDQTFTAMMRENIQIPDLTNPEAEKLLDQHPEIKDQILRILGSDITSYPPLDLLRAKITMSQKIKETLNIFKNDPALSDRLEPLRPLGLFSCSQKALESSANDAWLSGVHFWELLTTFKLTTACLESLARSGRFDLLELWAYSDNEYKSISLISNSLQNPSCTFQEVPAAFLIQCALNNPITIRDPSSNSFDTLGKQRLESFRNRLVQEFLSRYSSLLEKAAPAFSLEAKERIVRALLFWPKRNEMPAHQSLITFDEIATLIALQYELSKQGLLSKDRLFQLVSSHPELKLNTLAKIDPMNPKDDDIMEPVLLPFLKLISTVLESTTIQEWPTYNLKERFLELFTEAIGKSQVPVNDMIDDLLSSMQIIKRSGFLKDLRARISIMKRRKNESYIHRLEDALAYLQKVRVL